jgi:hypothetical protein
MSAIPGLPPRAASVTAGCAITFRRTTFEDFSALLQCRREGLLRPLPGAGIRPLSLDRCGARRPQLSRTREVRPIGRRGSRCRDRGGTDIFLETSKIESW